MCVYALLRRGPVAFAGFRGVCGLPELGANALLDRAHPALLLHSTYCVHWFRHCPHTSPFRLDPYLDVTHLVLEPGLAPRQLGSTAPLAKPI